MMKISRILIICMSLFLMVGCSGKKSIDESFLKDLASGLRARWNIKDDDEDRVFGSDSYKEYFNKLINTELDKIDKYRNETFEDSKLQGYAKEYLEALDESKEAIKISSKDEKKSREKWDEAYHKRVVLIRTFYNDYHLDLPKGDDLDGILYDAQKVDEEKEKQEKIKEIHDSIEFKKVKTEYGYTTYESMVTNYYGEKIDSLDIKINFYDKNKVKIDDEYCYVSDFKKDAKAKISFETDTKFDSMDYSVEVNIYDE